MTQYQNYKHHKLPITVNPLDFGKLIQENGNEFIIQLNTNNLVIIKQIDNENYIKFYRKGDLILEFRDTIVSENEFIRTISETRFTFKNNKLIYTELKLIKKVCQLNSNNLYYGDSILIKTNIFENIIPLISLFLINFFLKI